MTSLPRNLEHLLRVDFGVKGVDNEQIQRNKYTT